MLDSRLHAGRRSPGRSLGSSALPRPGAWPFASSRALDGRDFWWVVTVGGNLVTLENDMRNHRVVDIPGHPQYAVTEDGRVWSKRARKFRKTVVDSDGTERVMLSLGQRGQYKKVSVGRLVLLAYVGPPPEGCVCCHGSAGRLCHRLENLCWGTRKKNQGEDRRRDGTLPQGETHVNSRLSSAEVDQVREWYAAGVGPTEISRRVGCSRTHVHRLVNFESRQVS